MRYSFTVRKTSKGVHTDRTFTKEFPGGYVGAVLRIAQDTARTAQGRLVKQEDGAVITWHESSAQAVLGVVERRTRTCGHCGATYPSDRSCLCFDNGGE